MKNRVVKDNREGTKRGEKSQKVAKDQKSNRVMRKRDEREITAPPEIALGKEKVEG